ncbi:extracellular solute-binding protein, family 3 [Rivularia sp. PCC 7116]|uniref:ABC transporter substrate-binding protein n=1 Tax=Rivularia sp. PCC 7116 TaxID=373994 RepID=UPI00029F4956|nr:ABC transporter substrate-binding protein [Rivularia sp. PCC 7116]AFY56658.1 extracellular solute-binding protein, family 3 [Rivularia sp. PCC 7116]
MAFLHFKKKSFKFITVTFLVSSICIFCDRAVSQTNSQANNLAKTIYPEQIRVGIRTASSAIGSKNKDGSYGGFCGEFLNTLQQEVSRQNQQIPVIAKDIANQYRGREYPRYDGLIANQIEIECGPNSRSSLKLKDIRDNKPFRRKIQFSRKNFHTTGIKLLLNKETAEELENTPANQLKDKLSALPIAALRDTTTLKQFRINKDSYKSFIPYPRKKQINQKLDVRDLALDDLEAGKVKAFASDAIILRTLLEEGVAGEPGYRKSRQPLKNYNYVLYPQQPGIYLPNLEQQQYGIAIKNQTPYFKWLRKTVDRVLDNPSLNQAKQYIKEYENGKEIESIPSKEIKSTPKTSPKQESEENKDKGSRFDQILEILGKATLAITGLTALVKAFSSLGEAFSPDGRNKESEESESG